MSKKVMVIALSFMVCASLFCGCWGNDSSSSSTPSSSKPIVSSSVPSMTSSTSQSGSMGSSSVISGSSSMLSQSTGISGSTTMPTSSTAAANAAVAQEDWALVLVNAAHPLPEGFTVSTKDIRGYDSRSFDARAATALEALLSDAERADNKLYLVSAYRSVAKQSALFKRKVALCIQQGMGEAEAEAEASTWVARPGTSEHNLGLAADIVSADWYTSYSDLVAEFDKTEAFKWLTAHAADYGFILRYPLGKESVTGIAYEPWHYRYVGSTAAKYIKANELTLEEYCENLQ